MVFSMQPVTIRHMVHLSGLGLLRRRLTDPKADPWHSTSSTCDCYCSETFLWLGLQPTSSH